MDEWADDLLALAEEPVVKRKKDKKKKRKRESSGSASDMDVSGGSDIEAVPKAEDSDDDAVKQEEEARPELFPYEGIYKDSADKARLANMTEIDRESELEERREKLQKYEDRQRLKQMVAEQDGGAASDTDAKPSTSTTTTRRKGATEKQSKLDELKRKRQSKKEREEKRARRAEGGDGDDSDEENQKPRRSMSPVDFTDDEDEDDTATRGRGGRGGDADAAGKKGKDPDVTKEQLQTIVIPRGSLAQFWPCPFFADYVTGAYVRIGVGQDNGAMVYRLAQIVGVAERPASRPYQLEKHKTDTRLTLAVGTDKRDFTMEMVSNSEVTDREFDRFKIMLGDGKGKLPSKKAVDSKKQLLDKYKNYMLTEGDINTILTKKREFSRARGGMELHERHTLTNQRDIAKRMGQVEEVARINEILSATEAGPPPPSAPMLAGNGGSPANANANKGAMTLDDRRKHLAAGLASGTPKALSGKTSANPSRPGSGASTPLRFAPSAAPDSASNGQMHQTQSPGGISSTSLPQNSFQKLLASKIDVDLGDF